MVTEKDSEKSLKILSQSLKPVCMFSLILPVAAVHLSVAIFSMTDNTVRSSITFTCRQNKNEHQIPWIQSYCQGTRPQGSLAAHILLSIGTLGVQEHQAQELMARQTETRCTQATHRIFSGTVRKWSVLLNLYRYSLYSHQGNIWQNQR